MEEEWSNHFKKECPAEDRGTSVGEEVVTVMCC